MSWPGATVWVASDEAERGSVPARCARTGERCITRYSLPATALNPVLEWLLWTGLWPLAQVRPEARGIDVVVPMLPRIHRRHRVLTLARDATAAAVPGLLILGALIGGTMGGTITRLALIALIAHAAVAAAGLLMTVDVRCDHTGRWVRYDRVDARFAADAEQSGRRPTEAPVRRAVRGTVSSRSVLGDEH